MGDTMMAAAAYLHPTSVKKRERERGNKPTKLP